MGRLRPLRIVVGGRVWEFGGILRAKLPAAPRAGRVVPHVHPSPDPHDQFLCLLWGFLRLALDKEPYLKAKSGL
jgi:hypothetical protein